MHEGYEIRNYPAQYWSSTKGYSMQITDSQESYEAFNRLFEYITGQNEANEVIDMTAPVTTFVIPGAGPNCESNFTMSSYIPDKYQASPLAPTNPEVFLEYRESFDAMVTSFSGYATDADYIAAAAGLYNKATIDGVNVQAETWYMVGYDAPFQIANRLNEVWYEILP